MADRALLGSLKMAERIQIDLEDDNFNTYENSTPKGVNEPLEKYAHELYLSFLDNPAITVAHGGGGLHKDASGRDDGATAENGISHCDGFHKIPIKHLDKGKGRT